MSERDILDRIKAVKLWMSDHPSQSDPDHGEPSELAELDRLRESLRAIRSK